MTTPTSDDAVPGPPPPPGAGHGWQGVLVDAHHHLWDPAEEDQGWLDEPGLEVLRHRFAPDDLRAAAAGAPGRPLVASVVVQSVATVRESAQLLATAAADPTLAAVVGWVDLAGDVPAQLDRLRGGPGGELLRGVRHLVQSEPDPGWLDRPDVRRGLGALERAGLVYDVLVRAHQLPAATRLAAALPGLPLVLDHAGKPGPGHPSAAWEQDVRDLARHPHVVCKVSGLLTELDLAAAPGALAAVVDVLLDAFGPDRLMWGSDWPVCLLAGPWERWAGLAADLLAPLSSAEQDAVLAGTAARFYGLDENSPHEHRLDDPAGTPRPSLPQEDT